MNIKKIVKYLFCFQLFYFFGCNKKNNNNLAQNFYQLALLELEDKQANEHAYRKALFYANRAVECSNLPLYKSFSGSIHLLLNQPKNAIEIFENILKDQSLDPILEAEIKNNYACALAQAGNYNLALKSLSELIENKRYLTPEVAFMNQAKILVLKQDFEKAKKALQDAILHDPNYVDAHFNLAMLSFYNLNDLTLAKDEIKKSIFLDPQNTRTKQLYNIIMNKKQV